MSLALFIIYVYNLALSMLSGHGFVLLMPGFSLLVSSWSGELLSDDGELYGQCKKRQSGMITCKDDLVRQQSQSLIMCTCVRSSDPDFAFFPV